MMPGFRRWSRTPVPSRSTSSDSMNAVIAAFDAL